MTVTVYQSTDAGAPTLNGTAGSLIAVLDACLVNGFGTKPPAGFAKTFAGTNLASYRAATGNRFHLRVNDADPQQARLLGYEALTDINTGTGPFPTDVQMAGGGFFQKSNVSSTAAVAWYLITNGKMVYLFGALAPGVSFPARAGVANPCIAFGDFVSNKTADAFNTIAILSQGVGILGNVAGQSSPLTTAFSGNWIARSFTQIGSSVLASRPSDSSNGPITYPDPVTGGILLHAARIGETSPGVERGYLPGLWFLRHAPGAVGNALDTFVGSGDLAGKTFQLVDGASGNTFFRLAIEISDTW